MAGSTPDWVPLKDVLQNFTAEDIEVLYPGITKPLGHLPYVKFSTDGQAFIRSPDAIKAMSEGHDRKQQKQAVDAGRKMLNELTEKDGMVIHGRKPRQTMTKEEMMAARAQDLARGAGAGSSPDQAAAALAAQGAPGGGPPGGAPAAAPPQTAGYAIPAGAQPAPLPAAAPPAPLNYQQVLAQMQPAQGVSK